MPKYLVEREIPGAGSWSAEQRRKVAEKSNGVLGQLGPEIQWVESYVTGDKVYCVSIAPSADLIRKHAAVGGFPANRISEITGVMDPNTARG
jgi:hypothetical protein